MFQGQGVGLLADWGGLRSIPSPGCPSAGTHPVMAWRGHGLVAVRGEVEVSGCCVPVCRVLWGLAGLHRPGRFKAVGRRSAPVEGVSAREAAGGGCSAPPGSRCVRGRVCSTRGRRARLVPLGGVSPGICSCRAEQVWPSLSSSVESHNL